MNVEIKDRHQNSVQIHFSLDSTFGDVRNAVNRSLPSCFVVTEFELVPLPFGHYVEDDAECFKGPGDDWFVADVFFDTLAAGLRRCEADAAAEAFTIRLPLASLVPLGPPHRVGVLFPGDRAVDATSLEALLAGPGGAHAARLLAAASAARGHDLRAVHAAGGNAATERDAALMLALATIEARMCCAGEEPEDVEAVCGFGTTGETAALVFCGALTLEEGLELGDARTSSLAVTVPGDAAASVSVLGGDRANIEALVAAAAREFGPLVVSHDLFDGAVIVGGARPAVNAFATAAVGTVSVRPATAGNGAHTPLAVSAASAYADALAARLANGALRLPLYCAGGMPTCFADLASAVPKLGASLAQPITWRTAIELMLRDNITHFVDAGGATQLKTFMAHISPRAALL
eukprot:CAMPEP_0119287784 /NCGR_PEP_ID=MMETSP1329-20130426/36188_1 /TAXON_ID=114041 /ORGANISM="Genus nov. species nov., Strain RCC1024" /LENGTH=405 /DNA_ID=CAMNT_0007288557 /DNA_START=59 /DNA_END=1273 /DNA_ORIENTATION=+